MPQILPLKEKLARNIEIGTIIAKSTFHDDVALKNALYAMGDAYIKIGVYEEDDEAPELLVRHINRLVESFKKVDPESFEMATKQYEKFLEEKNETIERNDS